MKIGKYELRKPWVKYVEIPLEEELYKAVRRSIGEDIAKEIREAGCKCSNPREYCDGYNNAIKWAARFVSGKELK